MKSQTSSIRKSVESKISIFFKKIEVKQALRWMIIVDNYDAGCQNMVSVMQDAENFCKAEESKLWSIGKSALNFGLSNLEQSNLGQLWSIGNGLVEVEGFADQFCENIEKNIIPRGFSEASLKSLLASELPSHTANNVIDAIYARLVTANIFGKQGRVVADKDTVQNILKGNIGIDFKYKSSVDKYLDKLRAIDKLTETEITASIQRIQSVSVDMITSKMTHTAKTKISSPVVDFSADFIVNSIENDIKNHLAKNDHQNNKSEQKEEQKEEPKKAYKKPDPKKLTLKPKHEKAKQILANNKKKKTEPKKDSSGILANSKEKKIEPQKFSSGSYLDKDHNEININKSNKQIGYN